MQAALAQAPGLEAKAIEDAIVGCSFPEGEAGMNIARVASVLAGFGPTVGGVTVNRYCASGITAIQMAADRIRVGEADVMFRRRRRVHVHDPHGRQQAQPAARDL